MKRWPIERVWLVDTEKTGQALQTTRELAQYPVCCLLGSAGLGKTWELQYLADLERCEGFDIRHWRLIELGASGDALERHLDELASSSTATIAIYLDALDEAMVPIRTAGTILAAWVRRQLVGRTPRLRIACRSAVWQREISEALRGVYDPSSVSVASLRPLEPSGIYAVAKDEGLDADTFSSAVESTRVHTLASHPLTLRMLLRLFREGQRLTGRRCDIMRDGLADLANERRERREGGTAVDVAPSVILETAERLACYTLLSGRETIDMNDEPTCESLGWAELVSLATDRHALDERTIRATLACGLFEDHGPSRFRFGHRQFAEYLAGRRIALLLLHQAKSLLASPLGADFGVAGPLRETAAFAAMLNTEIAAWLADRDPEVIGLSDIAEDALRRRALEGLFERLHRGEITDSQFVRDEITVSGFQYTGAETYLKTILDSRRSERPDALECAVDLAEKWNAASLSESLADLFLDRKVEFHPRVSAGYALLRIGTPQARARMLPLAKAGEDDPYWDLKGLALRCNWPERITTPELFDLLDAKTKDAHVNSYDSFILVLDGQGFNADGHRATGLAWARRAVRKWRGYDPLTRVASRIAHTATHELGNPEILHELARLLVHAATAHEASPLDAIEAWAGHDNKKELVSPAPLPGNDLARRALLDAIFLLADDYAVMWHAIYKTPGLRIQDDVPYLIAQATDVSRSLRQRENYAQLAAEMFRVDSSADVEAWLASRDNPVIAKVLGMPLSIELDSDLAARQRKNHADMLRMQRPRRPRRLVPTPPERVERLLNLCETKDPRFFINLCSELTLEGDSEFYGFDRFVARTPEWQEATSSTRERIAAAAKALLVVDCEEPRRARSEPYNSILVGYMHAIFLLLEIEPAWFGSLSGEWWSCWAYYIVRELHPTLHDEPESVKSRLMALVHARAPSSVREAIIELAVQIQDQSRHLLSSTLEVFTEIPDGELDNALCETLVKGVIPLEHVGTIAEFVLTRDVNRSLPACVSQLECTLQSDDLLLRIGSVLLKQRPRESWPSVMGLLTRRGDLAKRILETFAQDERRQFRGRDELRWGEDLNEEQIGGLLELLIEYFPYQEDPKRDHIRASFVGPDDSARSPRDRLMEVLSASKEWGAVLALRRIERKYGTRYLWLRRPRVRAERAFYQSQWRPIPAKSIADLMNSHEKRLVRSGSDALEGVVEALRLYEQRLRHDSPADLEDFWNLSKGAPPSPKAEERISDKLCTAIREYFAHFAVSADREVQVYRRLVPKGDGGAPGSEVDVLARIPAAGSARGDAIAIPVEVKLSSNPEARTGLKGQLVDRYMSELGTSVGVFVVVWMDAPRVRRAHRPIWTSIALAREELREQERQTEADTKGEVTVRALVLDASLVSRAQPNPKAKRKTSAKTRGGSTRNGKLAAKSTPGTRPKR